MPVRSSSRKPVYFAVAAIAATAAILLAILSGRSFGARMFDSLRIDKPQPVNINLSEFVGPSAHQSLQQMVNQMISDQVVTTRSESAQSAANAAAASNAAGFSVKLLKGRSDTPAITVLGTHAYDLTVDRNRLQAIFDEAGRRDLLVPQIGERS